MAPSTACGLLSAAALRSTLSCTGRRSLGFFVLFLSVRRISRTLVDPAFSQSRQLLVGGLLFVKRLLQELRGFGVPHRLRPRDEHAVGGHLVVFSTLSCG